MHPHETLQTYHAALLRSDLAEHTTGLRWVLERVASAQQRSEAALRFMLGQAWSTEDLAFYAAAAGTLKAPASYNIFSLATFCKAIVFLTFICLTGLLHSSETL